MVLLRARDNKFKPVFDLTPGALQSIVYHNYFEYPLTSEDLIKWEVGKKYAGKKQMKVSIGCKNGYYFLQDNKSLIFKRLYRQRCALNKYKIVDKVEKFLALQPWIKGVFVSGGLAMDNVKPDSDIDLLIITAPNRLWTARLFSLVLFRALGIPVRRAGERIQKDRLCFNMWLDENNMVWPKGKRNIFTAHEIVQLKPVVNKNDTYEKLLYLNRWTADYWPNAALKVKKPGNLAKTKSHFSLFEKLAYLLQKAYMQNKITGETVAQGKAFFHPIDLGKNVLSYLEKASF